MKIYLIIPLLISWNADASELVSDKYTIDSDRQLILPDGNIKATGHVHAVSGDMTIDADEAVYHRKNPENTYITATGLPVKYRGITEDGRPFSGVSGKLKYTPDTGEVLLTDDVSVQQDGYTLSADMITYNIYTKKMTAFSVPGKRVKSVIYPGRVSQKS